MRAVDVVRSATRNAFRSKLRTTLTVLSLFVGAFTLTLTTALGAGVNDYVERQVATVSTGDILLVSPAASVDTGEGPAEYDPDGRQQGSAAGPLGSGALLNQDDLDAIAAIDGVTRVEAVSQISIDWIAASGEAADTRYELTVNPTASIGRSDLVAGDQLDQDTAEFEIVLPDDYVTTLGFDEPQDAVGRTVTLGYTDAERGDRQVEATVVGVARGGLLAAGAGANAALVDEVSEAQAVPGQPRSWALAVATLAGSGDDGAVTAADIDGVKAALAADDLAGQTVEDQLGVVQTVINGIIGVLSAFAAIALLAASFGIVNTLLMSVQERTREIGLMKAMGMSNGKVFSLFSLEAVVIGLLGAALGALAAIGVGSAIAAGASQTLLADLPGLQILLFEPASVITVIVVIMAIAFLSGVLPARRAARQHPIESLRYE
ncbi:MAG: ABC transporter permease [Candidatus Microbacterium phytovorans]|uniref:ABC transporter permease n=1 Tax=Candidatus Microbacterium phytovorans TaxID=3121374 RepID=A0AAJ5W1R8_9MICO|nr:ABC transporter permease [Microbacterium sp.]WEK13394.1 MAG: ABC transporter permease [Microbacterium sp.]